MMNATCNSTLEDLRILPTSEVTIAGPLTFHQLAIIISGAASLVAILLSLYLIWMHALHYTKPNEQKHIIRILFMIPVYAAASFLSLRFYWHAIYFQVISDCYEAFAISSFFALLCSYIRADLHDQKSFFRDLRPITPWVLPLSWFRKCCGGERGPWRTPTSGLTWFNIIWIGIYHYCFIRVSMTITAVVTQYFGRYCESSNLPVFSHIWIIVFESVAVTIAMYCVIQFYVQLRTHISEHKPFLKVLAIKLVIFLSFWQSAAISVGTSTLHIVHATSTIAYPDIKVGIPSMLLCIEMAIFSVLHLWAFPYRPYLDGSPTTFYPVADPHGPDPLPKPNEHLPRSGGFLGLRAIFDALNIWDVVKAFGRGVRWLFVGVRHRKSDISYQTSYKGSGMDLNELTPPKFRRPGATGLVGDDMDTGYESSAMRSTDHLPIATQFRRSRFDTLGDDAAAGPAYAEGRAGGFGREDAASGIGMAVAQGGASVLGSSGAGGSVPPTAAGRRQQQGSDEAAGLIAHAQPMSTAFADDGSPERYRDSRQGSVVPGAIPGAAELQGRDMAAYQDSSRSGAFSTYDEYDPYGAGGRGRAPLPQRPQEAFPPDREWGGPR